MSTADNTPDFDSMSPEELMAWMETLAERQGATEGFTTETRLDIAEVDPDSVEVQDNYIPYGMTEEQWAQKKAEEEAEKAAKRASKATTPLPAQPAVPQPEPDVVQTQPAASGGETPDFDSMSPEEMMRWMESLAKRQGADAAQFTTQADMQVVDIDPSTVQVEDHYWDDERLKREERKRQSKEEVAAQPQAVSPPEPEPEAELPEFELPSFEQLDLESETEIAPPADATGGLDWLESLATESGADFPQMDLSSLGEELGNLEDLDLGSELASLDLGGLDALAAEPAAQTEDATDPMAWLQSLSEEQEPAFELSSLEPEEETAFTPASSGITDPTEAEDVDPLEWLESLAKRQGADAEEFITDASLDVPTSESRSTAPGYTDYTFETADASDEVELPNLEFVDALDSVDTGSDPDDPVAWLDSLAASHNAEVRVSGYTDEEMDDEPEPDAEAPDTQQIMSRLHSGQNVDSDEMANWMANLLEQGAKRTDAPPDYIEEEDEDMPIEASIPDWLIEQVGPPPEMGGEPKPAEEPALNLDDVLDTTPEAEVADLPDWLAEEAPLEDAAEPEIPDWLQEPAAEQEEAVGSIFAAEEPSQSEPISATPEFSAVATSELDIDTTDPWVEAFEIERREGLQDVANVPDWYKAKLAQLEDGAPQQPAATLQQAELAPETELPVGEPEPLPDWLGQAMPMPLEEETPVAADTEELAPAELPDWLQTEEEPVATTVESDADLPDWLKTEEEPVVADLPEWLQTSGIEKIDTVPDWLLETVGDEDQPAVSEPAPAPTPAPAPAPQPVPSRPAVSPAPVVVRDIDADQALQNAKEKAGSGDIDQALVEYEMVVRANAHLETVFSDLNDMIRGDQKSNPAVYRVLGDSLMRQGRLQEALDTYRKALNLL